MSNRTDRVERMFKTSTKDKIIAIVCVSFLVLVLVAVIWLLVAMALPKKAKDSSDKEFYGRFVAVEEYSNAVDGLFIVYDKETKVMYYFIREYQQMSLSPMYNSDGTIKLWQGSTK